MMRQDQMQVDTAASSMYWLYTLSQQTELRMQLNHALAY